MSVLFLVIGAIKPQKTAALANCFQNNHFYNPSIFVQIRYPNGTTRYSSDFTVRVTAVNPYTDGPFHLTPNVGGVDTRTNAIRTYNSGGAVTSARGEAEFTPNTDCIHMFTTAQAIHFGSGPGTPEWMFPVLDCSFGRYDDGTTRGIGFRFTPVAVRDVGAGYGGGHWEQHFGVDYINVYPVGDINQPDNPITNPLSVNDRSEPLSFTWVVDPPDPDKPKGVLDQANCNIISGGAWDPNAGRGNGIEVHIYFDNMSTGYRLTADRVQQYRPDLPAGTGGVIPTDDVNHGFSVDTPTAASGLINIYSGFHTVQAYAINTGAGGGNTLIGTKSFDGSSCQSTFTVSPTVSKPLFSPDVEDPGSVKFVAIFNLTSPRNVNGVTVECEYFIDYQGGRPDQILGTVNEVRTLVPGATTGANRCEATYPVSGLVAGDKLCERVRANPRGGDVDAAGNISSPGAITEWVQDCEVVVDKPYLSFLGGDVASGGDFATTGSTCLSTSGGIKAFLKTGGLGSGVEFAAMAFGTSSPISGFETAQQHGSANSLAFSNTGSPLGNFGGKHCIKDFYADAATVSSVPGISDIDVALLNTGNFKYSGALIKLHGNLQNTVRSRLYIDGNLLISGPVNYASSSWANLADIPSLHVYVKGNIYIQNTVGSMVGVYVAQSSAPNSGEIVTCTDDIGTTIAGVNLFNDCGSQLKVRGALVANKIKWLRTANSLRNASSGDASFGSNRGAEVVELSPEFLMVAPPDPRPRPDKGYQYFTTLPPVL